MEDPGAPGGVEYVNAAFEAMEDAIKKYWRPDVDAYEQLALEDNRRLMRDFRGLMTIGPANHFFDGTLATHFNWADRIFNAHISPTGGEGLDHQRIYVSGGVTRALDDLAFRAFCNQGFFSWEIDSDAQLWPGCSCFFAQLHPNHCLPTVRYWDYTANIEQYYSAAAKSEPMFLPVVTNFYSGMPVGDEERLQAAALAADIGYSWVIAHEAGHYRNGHFHILDDHPDWFGIAPRSASEHLWMAEGAGKPSAIGKPELARQIEWDADRAAAESMVDLFFHPDQTSRLPSYCGDKPLWLFRLILVSMMMAALIFDRISLAKNAVDDHPSGLARLVGIVLAASRRLTEIISKGELIYDQEIAEFVGTDRALFDFMHDAIAEAFADTAVIAEILENENEEGSEEVPSYISPFGSHGEDLTYITYTTMMTMYRSPLKERFERIRDQRVRKRPSGRWADSVFEEVREYLRREEGHPIWDALQKQRVELEKFHAEKFAAARARAKAAKEEEDRRNG